VNASAAGRPWWESAVIYQIYPRSFQDSDGDGIGDLAGIARRLDYLASLGVDALWLSPIYPSPMADFGYDVADYCAIHPLFGDLAAFDALLAAAHARGLKLLLDFVPNHSSSEHPWFLESRASRDNPRRDWYIWRDPAPDGDGVLGPPNKWISDFGGSSWEWDEATGQYYLHAFLKQQPDLNWRNPQVRAAMEQVLRFWLARGVDGFRIDVLWHCIKSLNLQDNPPNPDYHPALGEMHKVLQLHSTDQPEIHQLAHEFRQLADHFGERLLIGEIYLPVPRLMDYYGTPDTPGVHLPFNFQLIEMEWDAPAIAEAIRDYERHLPPGGWPNWVLGNHDRPRIASRVGSAQARVAAMLLLTLRGTPTIYQGDELGLGDVAIPPHLVQDPRELREPGLGLGRDPVRTPMAWDASAQAGFTTGEPWLPLHADWEQRNVAAQDTDAGSMLALHRRLLALRREHSALSIGTIGEVAGEGATLHYLREHDGAQLVVALNLRSEAAVAQPRHDCPLVPLVPLLSTLGEPAFAAIGAHQGIPLRPDEGLILQVMR